MSTKPTNNTSPTSAENTVKNPAEIISNLMNVWEEYEFYDTDLWDSFREIFEDTNITETEFKQIDKIFLRKLRKYLRKRGVWVNNSVNVAVAKTLLDVVNEETRSAWPEWEMRDRMEEEEFTSPKIRNFLAREQREKTEAEAIKAAAAAVSSKPSSRPPSRPTSPTTTYRKVPPVSTPPIKNTIVPAPAHAPAPAPVPPPSQQFPWKPATSIASAPAPAPATGSFATNPFPLQSTGPAAPPQQWQPMPGPTYPTYTGAPYAYPPPPAVIVPSPSGYAKEIGNMEKLYKDNMKYSGSNDNFAHKLSIFHHFCSKADIPYEARSKAFSSMLRGFAFDYYLANVNMLESATLDQACTFIKSHFEKPDHGRNNLIKWNQTTLKSIMRKSENEGKSTLDCLEILINNLRHLQHGLDPQLQTELFMQNHLITACEEVPACRFACYKPNATLAGQITDLKNSISTYEKTHPNYHATDTYFSNRRHHGRPPSSKPRQRYLDRPPDNPDRSLIPYRPSANREKKGPRSNPGDDDEDDDLDEIMEAIILDEISEMRRNAY